VKQREEPSLTLTHKLKSFAEEKGGRCLDGNTNVDEREEVADTNLEGNTGG